MKHDELDDILSNAKGIEPSPGFVTGVMKAVQREASAPPPIPFPWKRAAPGMVVGVCTWVAFIAVTLAPLSPAPALPLAPAVVSLLRSIVEAAREIEVGWIATALVLVLASVKFSMRLVGARA